jgi:hypothetical protein
MTTARKLSAASPLVRARAGCNARKEPSFTYVSIAAVGHQGARADIEVTLPPPLGPALLDISMIHPRRMTYIAAASQTRGTVAALRDRSKFQAHAGHLHPATSLCPPTRYTGSPQ